MNDVGELGRIRWFGGAPLPKSGVSLAKEVGDEVGGDVEWDG